MNDESRIDTLRLSDKARGEVNEFVKQIVRFNPLALSEPLNAYSAATLLLLGEGRFLTPEDDFQVVGSIREQGNILGSGLVARNQDSNRSCRLK